jgi:hypothetical protein
MMMHLILVCPFAKQVWHEILAWLRLTCTPPDQEETLFEWWRKAKQGTPKLMRKGLRSITLMIPWMIWKHHNDCVFQGTQPSLSLLISHIKEEAKIWARAGAKGLRVILPTTWDVH